MTARFHVSFLFTLVSIFSFGQYLSTYPTTENTLLWKIEGNKIKKDSYIFGTIHLIYRDQFEFPDPLKKLVLESENVVLELGNEPQEEALKHMFLTQGTIFDFLAVNQKDSLLNWANTALGMSPSQFEVAFSKFKPFVISQMPMQLKIADKIESYDLTIQKIANDAEIPLFGLETIAEQMAIFDAMDTVQQRNMLMDLVRSNSDGTEEMEKMFAIYNLKNIDKMHQYILADTTQIGENTDVLLDKRNVNWIPKIEKFIKKKKTFIAVGAGHLGGENGVLRLLEKKGFTLKPIYL